MKVECTLLTHIASRFHFDDDARLDCGPDGDSSIVWPLLIYWLVLFVVCFVLVEIGHDQLYDEAPKYAGWRVFGGSLILASLLTALRYKGFAASFDSMFTTNIGWTLLQGVVWFLVFMFVFQFHPWHALGLGVVTMLLVSGLATMGVDSLLAKRRDVTAATRPVTANEPVRQSLGPGPAPRLLRQRNRKKPSRVVTGSKRNGQSVCA